MKKLYVVTGANGHLGSTIRRKLIQSGEKVRGLILPAESPFFPEEAEYVKGDVTDGEPVLCRVHSECLTGDVFGSLRGDGGDQLAEAMRRIGERGRGVLLYMRQEGRGIGLINKLKAYHLQDEGMDTVEANIALGFKADLREYGTGAEILADLGVKKMILMTNNPLKINGLTGYGIEIVGREPIEMTCNEKNEFYMYTKYKKMGHMIHVRQREEIEKLKEGLENK